MSNLSTVASVLTSLVDIIVPGSEKNPSASDAGIGPAAIEAVLSARPDLVASLVPIAQLSNHYETPNALAAVLRESEPDIFATACFVIEAAYLTDLKVWSVLHYEGQKPMPVTNEAEASWEEITTKVRNRRQVFRSPPAAPDQMPSDTSEGLLGGTTRVLNRDDVRSMEFDVVEALLHYYAGTLKEQYIEDPGCEHWRTPGITDFSPSKSVNGLKWPRENEDGRLDLAPQSTILLSSAATGQLLGVLDGSWITETRIAATAVLGVKALVTKGGRWDVGVIGCGRRATAVLRTLLENSSPVGQILLNDVDEAKCRYIERQILPLWANSVVVDDPREANQADVVLLSGGKESLDVGGFSGNSVVCILDPTSEAALLTIAGASAVVVDDPSANRELAGGRLTARFSGESVLLAQLIEGSDIPASGVRVVLPASDAKADIAIAHRILLEAEERGLGMTIRM